MAALVVTVERYRAITGDTTSPTGMVETAIEDAQRLLEDELGRQVGYGTRTETVVVSFDPVTGATFCVPSVTPIHSAAGLTVDGDVLRAVTPDATPGFAATSVTAPPVTTVTYVAGWDRDIVDPDDLRRVPGCVERDVAYAAQALLDRQTTSLPAGARVVKTGDVSVTFDRPVGGYSSPDWSPQTLRYRRRRL